MSFMRKLFGRSEPSQTPESKEKMKTQGSKGSEQTSIEKSESSQPPNKSSTQEDGLQCHHCRQSFNFTQAERKEIDGGGFAFTCPHCSEKMWDNRHPDCHFWHNLYCSHDPSHRSALCSLPSDISYRICALL